ncbi:phosphatase PAP2 family protein [Tardiphaga sp. 538_B7_N1_4]|uniref:phosphatase PAP2 family protein n=1 Tax=Tardiphaga sp. 538_B7_N1_4 TaxID=3240778 RepID=UPI003F2529F2
MSGRANDGFPSGHAMHMGALASAASSFDRPYREFTWTASVGVSLTRIYVLAHWTSDVVAGFASGFLIGACRSCAVSGLKIFQRERSHLRGVSFPLTEDCR